MSKRVSRITIAVLASLIVIAVAVTSVQALGGILRTAETNNSASMPVNNRALGKSNANELESYYFNNMDAGHNCGSDPTMDY